MKRHLTTILVRLLVGLFVLGIWGPLTAKAQVLLRLKAEWQDFNGGETFTNSPPPGIIVYNKNVFVPAGVNTLYVTFSGFGDDHGGNTLLLTCMLNGAFCNPGTVSATGLPWVAALKHFDYNTACGLANCWPPGGFVFGDGGGGAGDMHDNTIYATWCNSQNVMPGAVNNVQLKLASSPGTDFVFYEAAHIYIDASALDERCHEDPPDDASVE